MSRLLWAGLVAVLVAVGFGVYSNYDGFDPESLRGATVVITGCSTGIGEEMAYQYARLGAKILITARRENRLKEVVAKAKSLGAQEAHYVAGDMGKAEDCERTIQTVKDKFGRLDYLVLNHDGSNVKNIHEMFGKISWDQDPDMNFFEDYLQVNLVSYVRLASMALSLLKESSGHIVAVSGLQGKVPFATLAWGSAGKFAVDGFFSSLRVELMKAGQDVSVTLPVLGFIRTPMVEKMYEKMEKGQDMLDMAAPMDEAALAIIRGGATRAREVYYPAMTRPLVILRAFFPNFVDSLLAD
ncbi:PREDICTED: hydroxysteroid 11-beta-dehydrogenase 1-like protein [Branchiostoma belcheri]|uniref:Hydroxysteroid 11-beta-dehydrogenase 1-like protein n=1 Tax=Branchiostoma belcheri TaxID=7741 RepID=A0A6P4Y046_BRABE|nr:PREDICTED: hydroxysteroid 11-beta-dehydrogenase 1-like protein [Branchiostoma belcheri]